MKKPTNEAMGAERSDVFLFGAGPFTISIKVHTGACGQWSFSVVIFARRGSERRYI